MYQLKLKGEYKPYYFNITNLSFYSPCYLFHEMYKWFLLKEKFFSHLFLYFPISKTLCYFVQVSSTNPKFRFWVLQFLGQKSVGVSLRYY
jgi:hypothetical protein